MGIPCQHLSNAAYGSATLLRQSKFIQFFLYINFHLIGRFTPWCSTPTGAPSDSTCGTRRDRRSLAASGTVTTFRDSVLVSTSTLPNCLGLSSPKCFFLLPRQPLLLNNTVSVFHYNLIHYFLCLSRLFRSRPF